MTDSFRELDLRSHDRIDVAMLWREEDDLVVVTVSDGKTGTEFAIYVREDEQPLDVFHHPFAYAAHRGIDTEGATASTRGFAGRRRTAGLMRRGCLSRGRRACT